MSTATVLYVLNQGGNLVTQLPATTAKLEALRAKAVQTTAAVSTMGATGTKSAGGIGALVTAMGRFAGPAAAFTAGVAGIASGTAAFMRHAVALEKQLRSMGVDTGGATKALLGYESATDRLSAALAKLELTAATAMSGDLGRLVDVFTGAAVVADKLIDKFGGVASGLRDIGAAAVETLGKLGGPLGFFAQLVSGAGTLGSALGTIGAGQPSTPYDGPIFGPDLPPGFSPDGRPPPRAPTAAPAYQNLVKPISGVSGQPGLFDPAALDWFDRLTSSLRTTVTAMDPLPGALDQLSTAAEEGFRKLRAAAGVENATSVIGAVGSGDLGTVVGSVGAAAGAGPVGMLIAAIISVGPKLDELGATLTDQLMDFLPATVDAMVSMMEVNGRNMAKQLPQLAEQIGEAIPELVLALAANLPAIIAGAISGLGAVPVALVRGIAQGVMDGAKAFPDMFTDAILRAWRAIKNEWAELFSPFNNPFRGNGNGNGNGGGNGFLGLGDAGSQSRRGGGNTINVGTVVAPDVRRFNEELRRAQGTHGYGLTLDPLVKP